MTFPGMEAKPKEPDDKPLRTYEFFKFRNSGNPERVEAHYIQYNPAHVSFWKSRPDNVQDTLVLSVINTDVLNLKEVTA
jgi:hypothetical protein